MKVSKVNKVNKIKFVDEYFSLDDKIKFLQSFDLINLQKAAKIGNIPSSKLKTRRSAIKSILAFDLKNKFLICQNIFNNLSEYYKKKVDDVYTFKTIEWNLYEFDHMRTKEWELIKNDLEKENKIFFNQVNINAQNVTIPLSSLQNPSPEIVLSSLESSNSLKLNKAIDIKNIESIASNTDVKEKIVESVKEKSTKGSANKKTKKASSNTKTQNVKSKKTNNKTSDKQSISNTNTLELKTDKVINESLKTIETQNSSVPTFTIELKDTKQVLANSNNESNKKLKVDKNLQTTKKNKTTKDNSNSKNETMIQETSVFDVENLLNNNSRNWNDKHNKHEETNIKYEIQNIDHNIEFKDVKQYVLNNLSKLNQINQDILDIKSNLHNINTNLLQVSQLDKLSAIEDSIVSNQKILNYLEENINKIVSNQDKDLDLSKKHYDQLDNFLLNNDFSKLSLNIEACNNTINQIMEDNKTILNSLLIINNKMKLKSMLENNTKTETIEVKEDKPSTKEKLLDNIKQITNLQSLIKNQNVDNKNSESTNNHVCCSRYKIKSNNNEKINDDFLIQEQLRHKNNLEQLWKKYEEIKSNNEYQKRVENENENAEKMQQFFSNNNKINNLLVNTLEKIKNLKEQNNRLFKENNLIRSQYPNKDIFNVKIIKKVLNTTSAK